MGYRSSSEFVVTIVFSLRSIMFYIRGITFYIVKLETGSYAINMITQGGTIAIHIKIIP